MELIVVGFHRSGTSLLTQLLHAGGLFVGEELLGAMPSNPYGHFEDREVLDLHRQILTDNGVGWQVSAPTPIYIAQDAWERMRDFAGRRQAAHPIWGFKEPRVCLFLGAWKYLMPDARFVVVYRDPSECVRSLHDRHARDFLSGAGSAESHLRFFREPDHGFKVWDTYNRAIINFTRQYRDDCLVLRHRDLVSGYPVVERVNAHFGAGLRQVPTASVFDPEAVGVQDAPRTVHDDEVRRSVARTWRDLEALANQDDGWE